MLRSAGVFAFVAALTSAARAQPVLPAEVHPSLLFTRDEVPQLQERIRREPYATWWATVLARASSPPDSASEERTKARYAKAAAFAWWLTGDDAYARTAAFGPTPETVMNFSKNSFSTPLAKPMRTGMLLDGSVW